MMQARQDLACCLGFDKNLYILGGINQSNTGTNSVDRFNWSTFKW